jgi:hypothetical protein
MNTGMGGAGPHGGTSASDPRTLAIGQIAPWFGRRLSGAQGDAALAALNARDASVFILDIAGGEARLHEKPGHYPTEEIAGLVPPSDNLLDRAHLYRAFLEGVVRARGFGTPLRLAFTTHDKAPFEPDLPLFAYQKRHDSRLVLWPDIEFLRYRFYADPSFDDPFPFAEKAERAIFVGATSGMLLTPAAVASLAAPRLRAAVHFRGSARVGFFLPQIVQCTTPEAAAAVAALDVAGRRHSWREMYGVRYLLAIDGNGVSCSRIALGLRSNSVLVKYDSPWQLHYFDRLLPWRHYIPVAGDADVTQAMDLCAATPGLAAGIAEAGRAFAAAWLSQPAVEDYAFELLRAYTACCGFDGG